MTEDIESLRNEFESYTDYFWTDSDEVEDYQSISIDSDWNDYLLLNDFDIMQMKLHHKLY